MEKGREKGKVKRKSAGRKKTSRSSAKPKPFRASSLPFLSTTADEKALAASRAGTADKTDGARQQPRRRLSRIPTKDEWLLLNAAEKGEVDTVLTMVWKGTDVLCRKPIFGTTPLGIAARAGHTQIVSILMEAGASIAEADEYGVTPLHWAATRGHNALIAAMITRASMPAIAGRRVSAPDPVDNSPEDSVGPAQPNVLPTLGGIRRVSLGERERPGTSSTTNAGQPATSLPDLGLTAKDLYGSTALHFAALRNDDATVYQLVTAGCDATLRNNDGRRPQDLTTNEALRTFLEEEELKLLKAQAARRSATTAVEKEKAARRGKRLKKKRPASVSTGKIAKGSASRTASAASVTRRTGTTAAGEFFPKPALMRNPPVATKAKSTPTVAGRDIARIPESSTTQKDVTVGIPKSHPLDQPQVTAQHHRQKTQLNQRTVRKSVVEGASPF